MAVVDESMDRQQFDRSHAQRLDVLDHLRVSETGIGPALLLGYVGMQLGEAFDV